MPYKIKASSDNKLIIVRHSGDVVRSEFEGVVGELERRVDPLLPPLLLIDVREADAYPDKAEYFLWLRNRGRVPPVVDKVALVTSRKHAGTIEHIASTYQRRGLDFRVFCSELDALQWLFAYPEPA